MASNTAQLNIRNFAQIKDVQLTFGDLTVLVGGQGTGKSLALQWLKVALDGKQMLTALRDAGETPRSSAAAIDLIFGVGMGGAWAEHSAVKFNRKTVNPSTLNRRRQGNEKSFYIPAHRAMLISDGWAAPFQKLSSGTPVVARIFSQNLFDRFNSGHGDQLFPINRMLKKEYREQIDRSVFHGGRVSLEQDGQPAKRLKLSHGATSIPFMSWTAGQREFTPLLLGLYHLLPSTKMLKRPGLDWVIIEEPEMGLHPRAITVVMLLVLELLWRGYRVVLSTHSPHVLTAVWMLRRLVENNARWQLVCQAFGVDSSPQLKKVAQAALKKSYHVHALSYANDDMVRSKDISTLDPDDDDDEISGWGGLTEFSSRFGASVRRAVNERPR